MEETSLVSACCLWILRHLDDKQVELKALDYGFENVSPLIAAAFDSTHFIQNYNIASACGNEQKKDDVITWTYCLFSSQPLLQR